MEELDKNSNLVSMTIEHAKEQANISEVTFLQIEKRVPNKSLQRTA